MVIGGDANAVLEIYGQRQLEVTYHCCFRDGERNSLVSELPTVQSHVNYLNCGEFNFKKKFKAELSF